MLRITDKLDEFFLKQILIINFQDSINQTKQPLLEKYSKFLKDDVKIYNPSYEKDGLMVIKGLRGSEKVILTPYMHVFSNHIWWFNREGDCMNNFNMEGAEKLNDTIKKLFPRATNGHKNKYIN